MSSKTNTNKCGKPKSFLLEKRWWYSLLNSYFPRNTYFVIGLFHPSLKKGYIPLWVHKYEEVSPLLNSHVVLHRKEFYFNPSARLVNRLKKSMFPPWKIIKTRKIFSASVVQDFTLDTTKKSAIFTIQLRFLASRFSKSQLECTYLNHIKDIGVLANIFDERLFCLINFASQLRNSKWNICTYFLREWNKFQKNHWSKKRFAQFVASWKQKIFVNFSFEAGTIALLNLAGRNDSKYFFPSLF